MQWIVSFTSFFTLFVGCQSSIVYLALVQNFLNLFVSLYRIIGTFGDF